MRLLVGRIGKAHGILGEATIEVRTDDAATRFALGAVVEVLADGALVAQAPDRVHQARELGDHRGAGLALDQPHAVKQQGHDQAMGQHLGHGPLQAHRRGGGQGSGDGSRQLSGQVGAGVVGVGRR